MQIDFDSGKTTTNLIKHGVSLAAAAELNWDVALDWIDDRVDYGKERIIALAHMGDVLYS
jgi:uncharacterized DUF497 family protein